MVFSKFLILVFQKSFLLRTSRDVLITNIFEFCHKFILLYYTVTYHGKVCENLNNMKESEKQMLLDNMFCVWRSCSLRWMTLQQTVSAPLQDEVPVFHVCILN